MQQRSNRIGDFKSYLVLPIEIMMLRLEDTVQFYFYKINNS